MRYPELLLLRSIRWWFVFSTAYKLCVHLALLALGVLAMLISLPRLGVLLTPDVYALIALIHSATTQDQRNYIPQIVIWIFVGNQVAGIFLALWPEGSKQ